MAMLDPNLHNMPPTGSIRRRFVANARRPAVSALVGLLALLPLLAGAVRLQAPGDPSPATGDAQVVAHGVARLGGGDLVWRVVRRSAPPPANAVTLDSSLGFLVADDGALLVLDEATEDQVRLAPGEAMLTRAGARQVRAALGPSAAAYYALELVDAVGATEAGDEELLYSSGPFAGPDANHDVDLVRDSLEPGETTDLLTGAAPTLVVATAGALDVATTGEGTPIRLAAGEAAAFDGPLTMTAAEEGATYLAAVVGPAVPSLTQPAVSPVASPGVTAAEPTADTTPDDTATTPAADETPVAEAPTDSDGDGLADAEEAELGTDVVLPDSDGDGLTDGDEVLSTGTDPLTADSDADGVLDGDELAQGTDPFDPASLPGGAATPDDSDGDGFLDADELNLGTDPSDVDTDDDGLTDGDEVYVHATGPSNPDNDGDGVVDGDEINNGTDPNDPTSV